MLYNKRIIKTTARVLLLVLGAQLIVPVASYALTSGPTQPEVLSFEPVGTTDMVDLFTGDFVYNIPLMDVEGYPVNIAYHAGIGMEQEASWVGLGWNINPGAINRTVRGLPDDFNGDVIGKTLSIKDEENIRIGLGAGAEILGVGEPILNLNLNASASLNISNYRGVSADLSIGAGVNVIGMASAGVNLGIGSQTGADVDYNLGLSFNTSQIINMDIAGGVGLNFGHGYNTRTAVKAKNFGMYTSLGVANKSFYTPGFSSTVPVGVQNIVPVITNSSQLNVYSGQLKLGGEIFGGYPHGAVYGMVSRLSWNKNGSRAGYGYLYLDQANDTAILDFTRDKDGMFNETMHFLPPGNMTYDLYSVTGQGTAGSFRPFRNDLGSVGDPIVTSGSEEHTTNIEAGIGNLFSLGANITNTGSTATSGPWKTYQRGFSGRMPGSVYEDVYFKQAGEATTSNDAYFNAVNGFQPLSGSATKNLPLRNSGSETKRVPRASLMYYFTGTEASTHGVASIPALYSYNSTNGFHNGANIPIDTIARVDGSRKGYQISEMVKVQTDGSRYIYGIPAMNTSQSELTFAVDYKNSPSGIITYDPGDDVVTSNDNGRDNFFSKTTTPAYAHSYLLTSVLSADYVDVKGDGPTDDDFGSFTKFNYTLKNPDFHWKTPYGAQRAQYNPGFKSDQLDDKASYVEGTREQWMLHSIESKNYVAEFYTSARSDGRGVTPATDMAYKLDSIRLFNKHDRFIRKAAAVPIKTVMFQYDYSLCKKVPNNITANSGKLTLKKIYIRYGNSDKSMLSPYVFSYGYNPDYSEGNIDRWGGYKPNSTALPNSDFPFVKQSDPNLDQHAGAWSMTTISLPSGGQIEIDYEADDYGWVQDKPAMEMFMLSGLGKTKSYSGSNQLYLDKNSPNTFFYFQRRKTAENKQLSLKDNYLKDQSLLYYNFDAKIVGSAYEPIKGYAKILDVGYCNNDSSSAYGYIQVEAVVPQGGGAQLNPVTYTGINFARYYLPHIMFPGNNADLSNLQNVLAGLKSAFGELMSLCENPVKSMVKQGKVKEVNLAGSFMRLNNPGLKKKGGGHRVKQLTFYDNWSALAGGNAQDATYGKVYDYTIEDEGGYGTTSSGVASYEPLIGGDENPFRLPVDYHAQSGSNWPPNDPVGLYQELPVGESLYPGAVVGYRQVTVKSIHQQVGRSAQSMDIHEFYTAKDFPVKTKHTPINVLEKEQHYSFKEQRKSFKASQGYSLVFNDMHGKPKRTETRILHPGSDLTELVSYRQYNYFRDNDGLSNSVPVLEYDAAAGKMKKVIKRVGLESDLTIDTREKDEQTRSSTRYLNLNTFIIFIPLPIPWMYNSNFSFSNRFNAVVATKVMQQYGILKEVESYQEGALTIARNEAFDPLTGQALVTSVNDEYQEQEYSVTYPAYWGYKSMGPSYVNTGYTQDFSSVTLVTDIMDTKNPNGSLAGILPLGNTCNFNIGDELLVSYTYNSTVYKTIAWVMRIEQQGSSYQAVIKPRMPYGVAVNGYDFTKDAWPVSATSLSSARVKVLRSGNKNQLHEAMQTYSALSGPFDGAGYLKDSLSQLVALSAKEYSDSLTAILPWIRILTPIIVLDIYPNDYIYGTRGIKRLHKEYAYIKKRTYNSASSREHGLFNAVSLWRNMPASPLDFFYNYMRPRPLDDKDWTVARTVTKWSPWGHEIENKDAVGNYTTAIYGYNHSLPVALIKNVRQGDAFFENFEDYGLLQVDKSWIDFSPSFMKVLSGLNVTHSAAHTGRYALQTGATANFNIPVQNGSVPVMLDNQPLYMRTLLQANKNYVVSYWFRPITMPVNALAYPLPPGATTAFPIIEGWQRAEYRITAPASGNYSLQLPPNAYVDDLRVFPVDANMKGFVYHPVNQRLVATLDENNHATLYEYDQEGNLIRTKKETEKGIMTVMESRSANAGG